MEKVDQDEKYRRVKKQRDAAVFGKKLDPMDEYTSNANVYSI
jgi:hypothetical protein